MDISSKTSFLPGDRVRFGVSDILMCKSIYADSNNNYFTCIKNEQR